MISDTAFLNTSDMERAWVALKSHAVSGVVRRPTAILIQEGFSRALARKTLLVMVREGRLYPDQSNNLYSVQLSQRSAGPHSSARTPPSQDAVSATISEAKVPRNESLTWDDLYEELLYELTRYSLRSGLDGYVTIGTFERLATHLNLPPSRTLTDLLREECCSLWVIQPEGLKEVTSPPSAESQGLNVVISIDRVPALRSDSKSGSDSTDERSNLVDLSLGHQRGRALPTWHPFNDWYSDETAAAELIRSEIVAVAPPTASPCDGEYGSCPSPTTPLISAAMARKPSKPDDQELDRACHLALREAMKEGGLVYGYMLVLEESFNRYGITSISARRAVVERLLESGFIERRGRSSVRVLDRTPPPKPL